MPRPADSPAQQDLSASAAVEKPSRHPDIPMVPAPPPEAWLHTFLRSFVYAYYGMIEVLATQRNMVVHCIIAIPVLLATQLLGFSPLENVVVVLCVTLVLACEAVNTAIERLGTHASPGFHPAIRRAKDASAAMVLFSAIGAAAVGVILFTSQQRPQRLFRWDVEWRWGGTIDNVMVKLMFLGIVWLFLHAWMYRRRSMESIDRIAAANWNSLHGVHDSGDGRAGDPGNGEQSK